jgi:opacity protein-like surface antigen
MRLRIVLAGLVVGFGGAVSPVFAQNRYPCKTGNFELGLFGGESYGLDRFRPMGGGNIAYGLNCHFFPFAEVSYLPGVLRTVTIPTGATTSYQQFNVNMTDFHGGLHIRVPVPESRVLPYAVVGLGLIRGSSSTSTVYNVSNFGVVPFPQTIPSSTNFAVNFGAGLRFFFSERFAVRVEFKGFKPTSAPAPLDPRVFYRFAIGPVFQLR